MMKMEKRFIDYNDPVVMNSEIRITLPRCYYANLHFLLEDFTYHNKGVTPGTLYIGLRDNLIIRENTIKNLEVDLSLDEAKQMRELGLNGRTFANMNIVVTNEITQFEVGV